MSYMKFSELLRELDLKDEPSPFQNREMRLDHQHNWDSLRGWGNTFGRGIDEYFGNQDQRLDDQIAAGTVKDEEKDYRHSDLLNKTFPTMRKRGDFVEDTLKDMRVNVQWFGADSTGQNDSWQAIQDTVDFINLHNLHVLYLPHGTYRITKNTKKIVLPKRITVLGDRAEIHIDDDSTIEGKSSLFRGGEEFLRFENLNVTSNLKEDQSSVNPVQFYVNTDVNEEIQIINCNFSYFRYHVLSSEQCKKIVAINNHFAWITRDCIRMLNCLDAFIVNNTFEHCGDDTISLHYNGKATYDYSNVSLKVAYNRFVESQGIGALGCDNLIVDHNVFLNTINAILKTGLPDGSSEGKRSKNIIFSHNIIDSPIHADVYSARELLQINPQTYNLEVTDNIFDNTHPIGTAGFVYWSDATIHEDVPVKIGDMTIINGTGIGDLWNIHDNIFNSRAGSYDSNGNIISNRYIVCGQVTRLNIYHNHFEDFIVQPIALTTDTTAHYAKINDNYFDGDLNNRLGLETVGLFTSNNQLNLVDKQPAELTRNEIRNVSSNGFSTGGNRVLTDFTVDKYVGVTFVFSVGDKIIPYSSAQGIINDIPDYVTELPTTGWFYKNTLLRYSGDNSKLLGWKRLKTGFGGDESTSWQRLEAK